MRLCHPLPLPAARLALTLAIAVACSDAPTPPLTPAAPAFSKTAAADFHRNNPQDWVGVAHNRALAKFFAGLTKRGDVCAQMRDIKSAADFLPPEHRTEHAAGAVVGREMLNDLGCPQRVGQTIEGTVSLATDVSPLSTAAGAIITQLRYANTYAVDATDLANQYNAILPATAALTPQEAEVINATASVGLSSRQYWDANTPAAQASMTSAYGDCVNYYAPSTDMSTTIQTCVGITQPVPRTVLVRFDGTTLGGGLWFAQTKTGTCNANNVQVGKIAQADFEAGFAAGVGAFVLSTPAAPISVPVAAAAGAFGGSTANFIWNVVADTWCLASGKTVRYS